MITLSTAPPLQNLPLPKKVETAKLQPQSEQSQYYKTRAGIKTAAVYATPGTILLLSMKKIMKALSSHVDEMIKNGAPAELKMELPKFKPYITVPLFLATTLGCGLFIDKKINEKNAKLAEDLKTKDKDNIFKDEENIEKTTKGNLYNKSKVGKHIGPILGPCVIIFNGVISALVHKQPIRMNAAKLVQDAGLGALGGLILGSITDHFANKGAHAHADKTE